MPKLKRKLRKDEDISVHGKIIRKKSVLDYFRK